MSSIVIIYIVYKKVELRNTKIRMEIKMSEKVIIRKARKEDFRQVHELITQVHSLHVKERSDIYKDINPLCIESFIEKLSKDTNIYLVAVVENKIIGFCFSQIKEISNNEIMKDRKILHIEDICVDENNRKNGIGKKLYNKIIELAKEINIDSIELMVWGFNKNAIKFYESLGMNIKNLRFEQKVK